MKIKLILFLFLFLFLFSYSLIAQSYFPNNCIGNWQGMMYMYKNGMIRDSVLVKLSVTKHPDNNAWGWEMQYLSTTMPATKDYTLRLPDPEKNTFITDEGGGVELQDYLIGNKLYSVFETGGFLLTAAYEYRENELIFEVTSGKKILASKNEINNYSVDNLQRVIFRRQ